MSDQKNPKNEKPKMASDLSEEQVKDLTEQRNKRCEPVVLAILKAMLDGDLLLADRFYVKQVVQQNLDSIFRSIVVAHHNEIFKMIEDSLAGSVKRATEILWKGKDNETVSLNDIDNVLKSATKETEQKEIPLEEK